MANKKGQAEDSLVSRIEQVKSGLLAKVPADVDLTYEITQLSVIASILSDDDESLDPGVEA
jgi:hypothetical protein